MRLLIGGLLVMLVAGAVGGLVLLDRISSGRILPNVSLQGVPLDRLTPVEARAKLADHYASFLTRPVTLRFEGRIWTPTPAELGITLDIDDAVERALHTGRGGDPLTYIRTVRAIWEQGYDLPIRVIVDRRMLTNYLLARAGEIEGTSQNAALALVRGQVVTTPARVGRQLLIDETAAEIIAGLPLLRPQTVTFRTRLLPPRITDLDIAAVQEQLIGLLSAPVTLAAGTQRWVWTTNELGDLVYLAQSEDASGKLRIRLDLDRRALAEKLQRLTPEIAHAPIEPRVRFVDGALRIVEPGYDGMRLDVEQAVDVVMTALWRGQRSIVLPVTVVQPQLRPDTIAGFGITELIAQGQSSFEGSAPYRVTNIKAGARRMDGVLIPPGAEVSFNELVGAIDETNGFTRGYAIIDGRTQLEWGGGVCQVSTTVFRAAFWAGLPITERNQHSFRIRWYEIFEPIGMDAAIFTGPGGYDLRFVNDTGHWLLMQTEVDTQNEVLRVNLYGTRPDREVAQTPVAITNETPAPSEPRYIEDPDLAPGTIKQTDTARGGMDVRVGRIVKTRDGIVRHDSFFSRFQPWPDIFTYAPGTPIPPSDSSE